MTMLCLSLATPGASTARGSGGGTVNATSGVSAVTGAYLCFEDEAGQNLRPPKARTWAPRGHTRVVRVSGRGSGRVSVAGLARYKPGARSRFFYRARTHRGRICQRRAPPLVDRVERGHLCPLKAVAPVQIRSGLLTEVAGQGPDRLSRRSGP
jgi:hypothetical protein